MTKCPERKEVMLGRDNERIFHHWKRCGKFKSIIPTLFPPNLGKTVKKGLPPIFARKLLNFTGIVKHLKMTTNQSDVLSNCKGWVATAKLKQLVVARGYEKSPFLLLPNQTKLAVPYDMKRSCIIVLMLPVRPRRYQGGLYNSIQTICLVLFS